MQTLPASLESLSGIAIGGDLQVEVIASEEVVYDDGSTGVDPGHIQITADGLTDRFKGAELRHRLDALVTEAVNEGDTWAARDAERIEAFLGQIAGAE